MKLVTVYPDAEPGLELWMPDSEADRGCWDNWELGRYLSIVSALEPGQVLWEVGAEHGVMAALYARHLGGGSLVLIEPSVEMWPDLRRVWEANELDLPAAVEVALVGHRDHLATDEREADVRLDRGWPSCAWSDEEAPRGAYRYLFEDKHVATVPTVTLDTLAAAGCPPPAGISIDVEGAELQVIAGGWEVLTDHRPIVWISIHPDLMARDFGDTPDELLRMMAELGYRAEHLATDHEEHWAFWPSR